MAMLRSRFCILSYVYSCNVDVTVSGVFLRQETPQEALASAAIGHQGSYAFSARAEDEQKQQKSSSCAVEGSACAGSSSPPEEDEDSPAAAPTPRESQQLLEIMQNVAEGKTDDGQTEEPSPEAALFQKCGMAPTRWRKSLEDVQLHPSWTTNRRPDKDFNFYKNETETLEKAVLENCERVKEALRNSGAEVEREQAPQKLKPSVAYVVIAADLGTFDQAPLWEAYFKGCGQGTANLYVHAHSGPDVLDVEGVPPQSPEAYAEEKGGEPWKKSMTAVSFWKELLNKRGGEAKFVKKVRSAWGELFGIMWWLIVNALQNEHNQHFVFISENSVPLKNCATVTKQLLGVEDFEAENGNGNAVLKPHDQSVSQHGGQGDVTGRTSESHLCLAPRLVDPEQKGYGQCVFEYNQYSALPKMHQWISLNRANAQDLVSYAARGLNMYIVNALFTPWRQMWGAGASDEAVVGAALLAALTGTGAAGADSLSHSEDQPHGGRVPFTDPGGLSATQHLLARTAQNSRTSSCVGFALWRGCFSEGTGIERVGDNDRGQNPRDFHQQWGSDASSACDEPYGSWRAQEPFMRSLVKYTGYLFARKMGETNVLGEKDARGKPKKELLWNLAKEAWAGAPVSLPQLWNEPATVYTGGNFEIDVQERNAKGNLFRKKGEAKYFFGKDHIPTALHAPPGSSMERVLAMAMDAGHKEAEAAHKG